jgi:hypothetical protein
MKKKSIRETTGYFLLITTGICSIVFLIAAPILPQDLNYHSFSDQFKCYAINNYWNVISNAPFLIVGLLGLKSKRIYDDFKAQKIVFFTGISLVAFGSGYYHLNPNNNTLIWDRLPMTIAFMALFSLIIGQFSNKRYGNKSLIPLLLLGTSSVIYWVIFDDLKFYALIQFYPLLAIPVILIFLKQKNKSAWGYWLLLAAYIVAKLFEHFDHHVHKALKVISGHSIKHIVAALGVYCLLYYFQKQSRQKG